MKKTLFTFFILIGFTVSAQTEDAWVYFTDKQNVATALANPITILTQAAIDRKNLHGTPIDARDVPVNQSYISQIKSATDITVFAKSKWFNCVYVRGSQAAINALANLAFVDSIDFANSSLNSREAESVKINFYQKVNKKLEVATDFTYGNTANQVEMLNVDYLHQQNYTGEGITIAVMDAGFPNVNTLAAFQRMRNNGDLLDGYDFVDDVDDEFLFTGSSHGTSVLSTITGFVQNDFVGTAPDASVYLFRTEDVWSETPVEMAYWVEAAERADSLGVFVINTSLGYSMFDNLSYSFSPSDMDGETAFISRGATVAFEKGMLVVNSAGNEGNGSWGIVTAPADSPGALAIGAVDANGNYASFSSTGPSADGRVKPDVAAQGASAAVITASGNISNASGTSFSSPIMAGAIASLWQADPSKTNLEIMQIVRQSASQFNNPDIFLGYGIPDFQAALANFSTEEITEENSFSIYPNPVSEKLYVDFSKENASANLQIYSILGRKVMEQQNVTDFITVSSLAPGMYLVKIVSEEKVATFKIVKK
ncbi:MAG TPA: S8 family serine peptidase [Flavobacteriaceae bacterium]|nr:S8 family serine peptidase [Flavobacteriaceae bacterium]